MLHRFPVKLVRNCFILAILPEERRFLSCDAVWVLLQTTFQEGALGTTLVVTINLLVTANIVLEERVASIFSWKNQ